MTRRACSTEEVDVSALRAGTLCAARAARPGLGVRIDWKWREGGSRGLFYWLVSPYEDTPDGGIVEDLVSMRRIRVRAVAHAPTLLGVGAAQALPDRRTACRNLISGEGRFLVGLRGWDIPHDRQLVKVDLESWSADVGGNAGLPESWRRLARVETATAAYDLPQWAEQ